MPQMSLTEYAASKGWTPQALNTKIQRGTITEKAFIVDRGMRVAVISEIADADIKRNGNPFASETYKLSKAKSGDSSADKDDWLEAELQADEEKHGSEVLSGSRPQEIAKIKKVTREVHGKEQEVKVIPPDTDDMGRFRNAKTSKEEMSARKLELEVAEMEGRLLDTEGVRKRIVKRVTETKDILSNLPGKLAPLLVGISDVVEMETTLQREINQACEALYNLGRDKWGNDAEE